MEKIILVIHVIAAISIVGLILLQQGKGAAMGASFGSGASQTVFGSQGSGNFFSRATALVAVVFFVTSFGLAVVAKNNATIGSDFNIPSMSDDAEIPVVEPAAQSEVPVIEDQAPAANDEVPAAPAEETEQ